MKKRIKNIENIMQLAKDGFRFDEKHCQTTVGFVLHCGVNVYAEIQIIEQDIIKVSIRDDVNKSIMIAEKTIDSILDMSALVRAIHDYAVEVDDAMIRLNKKIRQNTESPF